MITDCVIDFSEMSLPCRPRSFYGVLAVIHGSYDPLQAILSSVIRPSSWPTYRTVATRTLFQTALQASMTLHIPMASLHSLFAKPFCSGSIVSKSRALVTFPRKRPFRCADRTRGLEGRGQLRLNLNRVLLESV